MRKDDVAPEPSSDDEEVPSERDTQEQHEVPDDQAAMEPRVGSTG